MKNRTHGLDEKEMEPAKFLMADCKTMGDVQARLKRLFAGTIEQMLEAEMYEHLRYEKNSVEGGLRPTTAETVETSTEKKTISGDYGECEISAFRATATANLSRK